MKAVGPGATQLTEQQMLPAPPQLGLSQGLNTAAVFLQPSPSLDSKLLLGLYPLCSRQSREDTNQGHAGSWDQCPTLSSLSGCLIFFSDKK